MSILRRREGGEFAYLGDAAVKRPAADASQDAFYDYVYLRDNLAGDMAEYCTMAAVAGPG